MDPEIYHTPVPTQVVRRKKLFYLYWRSETQCITLAMQRESWWVSLPQEPKPQVHFWA
jgi:hypothetical protein